MSRFDGCRSLIARPSTLISPWVIGSSPAMVFSKVDLPQPDGPTSTKKPPSSRSISIPLRMSTVPNRFFNPSISRNAIESSFDGARHQATHEIAAGEHIDEQGRQGRDHSRRHVDVVFDHAGRGVDD